MRRISFSLALILILILSFFLFSKPISISSKDQLNELIPNQKIIVSAKVIKETQNSYNKLIHLNNDLILQCDLSCPSYLNKNIKATAKLERYNNKEYLKILKISQN